jgi:hypothetical protein
MDILVPFEDLRLFHNPSSACETKEKENKVDRWETNAAGAFYGLYYVKWTEIGSQDFFLRERKWWGVLPTTDRLVFRSVSLYC